MQQDGMQGDWDEGQHHLDGQAQDVEPDLASIHGGNDLGDARQQRRRHFDAHAEDAEDQESDGTDAQKHVGSAVGRLQRAPARYDALEVQPMARGPMARSAPPRHVRTPPSLAGFDDLFGADLQVPSSQSLAALARYAVAILCEPETVQEAGWTATSLLAFAAQRVVESTRSGEPAPSFQAIKAALVSARSEVAALEAASEPLQDLLVLLPLILWSSQQQRTVRQIGQYSARLKVLTVALDTTRR